ncbi:lysylphosphatidylglycerol synthase domain-containing protein [Sabulicella rubraurantiaca]|uniref:lysylphosphatidylglycerol synthase domain-containing protein n=1 Tax=Sabulicella rubraurantiaca TaxID=2811429 RepID=UPI001A969DC7|nr:lysylphosphatidylglycerol synthase domain-containing protein [Sabulicella rubraurantiaca]
MNRLGLILALGGFALAVAVIAAQDLSAVGALLAAAGPGLVLVALAHLPSMVLNAWAWAVLMPGRTRPSLLAMTFNVWVRESVNGLLPVGRIGGELASFRLLRGQGVPPAPAAGGLLMDVALSILSQLAFALLGLALLAAGGGAVGWGGLLLGFAGGAALGGLFIAAQRLALFGRMAAGLNRIAAGRLEAFAAHSARMDRYVRRAWRRPRAIALCFLWQFVAWVAGALEIWTAFQVLGADLGFAEALVIEALIQALSSAAFLVPGALGLQEAGFIGLGALVGLDPATSAALAVSRRLRDLLLYLPGLAAWALWERRGGNPA